MTGAPGFGAMLDGFLLDARLGLRRLGKDPGHAVVVAATLALGLGVNTAVFSLVDAILLRPQPGIREAERLVNVHARTQGTSFQSFSRPDYLDLRESARDLVGLAAFNGRGFSLGGASTTELVPGQLVSDNYFEVLGTRPLVGRLLDAGDARPGRSQVAVISEALWQRRFGRDPKILESSVLLNGAPFSVVGVAAPGFAGHFVGFAFDVWVPLEAAPDAAPGVKPDARETPWLEVVGRLVPGTTRSAAESALTTLLSRIDREYPRREARAGVDVRAMTGVDDSLRGPVLGFLSLLQAVALLVLLLTCANVATLVLARNDRRQAEAAVRLALGASPARLARERLLETLALFALGGGGGLALAAWSSRAFVLLMPRFPIPLRFDLSLDGRVLAYSLTATAIAGIVTGLLPALQIRRDVLPALAQAGPRVARRSSASRSLVVMQVAIATLLLVGAGLFARTLSRARSLDPGFAPDGVTATRLDLTLLGRPEARGRQFFADLRERAGGLPGARSSALVRAVPLRTGVAATPEIRIEGHENAPISVDLNVVSPGFFETLRIPLLIGRDFVPGDTQPAPAVAVVNRTFAARFFPGAEAIGKRIRHDDAERLIVGVVADSKQRSLAEDVRPMLYVPFAQAYSPRMTLLVRFEAGGARMEAALRDVVRSLDSDLPVLENMSLRELVSVSLFPQRMAGVAMASLGGVGLLLAALGLYGLVSRATSERTREIGLRLALGAGRAQVLRLVLGDGARLAAAGVGAGLLLALAAAHTIASFLPGIDATDPQAFAAAALIATAAPLAASFLPARRAASLDPAIALRHE